MAEFKVIEIMDDSNPYPVLLGIDWATDMNRVINLKKLLTPRLFPMTPKGIRPG